MIKSTVPVGFVESLRSRLASESSDVFRQSSCVRVEHSTSNLYPSRIVVGDTTAEAKLFANMLAEAAAEPDVPVLLTRPSEAEAIKLFSNTYLAMRVAFFNELDSFAIGHGLSTREVIDGVGLRVRCAPLFQKNSPALAAGVLRVKDYLRARDAAQRRSRDNASPRGKS